MINNAHSESFKACSIELAYAILSPNSISAVSLAFGSYPTISSIPRFLNSLTTRMLAAYLMSSVPGLKARPNNVTLLFFKSPTNSSAISTIRNAWSSLISKTASNSLEG